MLLLLKRLLPLCAVLTLGCGVSDSDATGGGGSTGARPSSGAKIDPDDPCERDGGAPSVTVGEGLSDYLPVDDGATLQVEKGPQGGYHVWVAARIKALKRSGSITRVKGRFPSLGYDVEELAVVFTMEPDEGGYCKLFGLRFRIDDPDHPVESLVGQDLDLEIEVTDPDGDVGRGKKSVRASATIR